MNEKLKDIQTKAKDFWNKYDKKQKRLIVSIFAVVVVAVIILAVVLSRPTYETLIECTDTTNAADIADTLTSNDIQYTTENNGLTIKVPKENLVKATYLIAQNGYTAKGYGIDDYKNDGGFSTTSEDKTRLYQKYLEDKMVGVLTSFDYVKSANVTFSIPATNYSVLATDEDQETFVSVQLTLKKSVPDGAAEAMARYCATAVGSDSTARVTIIDSNGNTLFQGNDSAALSGSNVNASEKEKIRQLYNDEVISNVTKLLNTTNLYSTVSVAPSLDISFDKVDKVDTVYSNDANVKQNDYVYEQEGGSYSGGVPGTDSNDDDTTYQVDTGDGSSTSITITKNEYAPSSSITHTEGEQGTLNKVNSSLSIAVNKYQVYDQATLEENGQLKNTTWEQYKAQNSTVTAMNVDFTGVIQAIAAGTGIPAANISVIGYNVPVFNDKVSTFSFTNTVLPIILAVIIVGLLGFVVWRSLRPVEVTETEPELSVDEILSATKEKESVEDIEYDEKSEVRKAIEKFVDENPESVALLLRNWLNNDWE